jgi:hypothetical protein
MRRLVSVLCVVVLAGCGGGSARTVPPPPTGAAAGLGNAAGSTSPGASSGNVTVSTGALLFTATGWSATQIVTTTWGDDSRKSAVSSDSTVATVSPPYQQATWTSPGVFSARYWITPVGPGTATITFSDHDGSEFAKLAVTVTAPPTGTLYVGGAGEIDAFPAAASGGPAPQRRITGFFRPFARPDTSSSAGAITVGADGTLYVVKNQHFPSGNVCEVDEESPSANGTSGGLGSLGCGTSGSGLATAAGGELDVLLKNADRTTSVQRFVAGRATSRLGIAGEPVALVTGPNGELYVASTTGTMSVGRIDQYAPGAADGAAPVRTIDAPDVSFFGAVAVAPDGVLYAILVVPDYSTEESTYTINAYAPGSTTPSRTIGPFKSVHVAALAVDKGGELYVAFNAVRYAAITSHVDVYAPNASGNANPVRTLTNPIPNDAPGGTAIDALALSPSDPAPPEEVLSKRRRP